MNKFNIFKGAGGHWYIAMPPGSGFGNDERYWFEPFCSFEEARQFLIKSLAFSSISAIGCTTPVRVPQRFVL